MAMFQILKDLKNYEMVCKKRGHHEPKPEDVLLFIADVEHPKETYCIDCGSTLELRLDDEDSTKYWIQEI